MATPRKADYLRGCLRLPAKGPLKFAYSIAIGNVFPHRVTGRLLVTLLTAGVAIACGFLAARVSPDGRLLLVGALALVLAAPILSRVIHGKFDLFEPVVVFSLAFGVMFVLRPAAMFLTDTLYYQRPSRTIALEDALPEAVVIALLASLAFFAGYAGNLGQRLAARVPSLPVPVRGSGAGSAAIATGLLGSASLAALLSFGGGLSQINLFLAGRSEALFELIKGTTSYFSLGMYLLVPAAVACLALGRSQHSTRLVVFGTAFAFLALVIFVPIGGRIVLLPLVGGLFVYWYLSHDRRPTIGVMVVTVIISLAASTLLLDNRDAGGRSLSGGTLQAERLLAPLTSEGDAEMAPAFASLLTYVPEQRPHTWGRATVGDLLIRPIPRRLWPDKPETARQQIIAEIWPAEGRAGIANQEFSVLAALYLDGGVPFVVVALFMFGVVARSLYDYLKRHPGNVGVQVGYALAVCFFVSALRDGPADTLVRSAFLILPVWLIFRRRKSGVRLDAA